MRKSNMRILAFLMSLCMVIGSFTPMSVQAEEGTPSEKLVAYEEIWGDDAEGFYVPEGAVYGEMMGAMPKEIKRARFAYVKDGVETVVPFGDNLTITPDDGCAAPMVWRKCEQSSDELVEMQFSGAGGYTITYQPETGDAVSIRMNVGLPEVGFYTQPENTVENLIVGEPFVCSDLENDQENSFYMVLATSEDLTISLDAETPFSIHNHETGEDVTDHTEYFDYVLQEESTWKKVYKVTTKKKTGYGFEVLARITGDGIDSESRNYLDVEYRESMTGLVVKDWVDWDEEQDKPVLNPQAEYGKEAWANAGETRSLYFAYRDSEDTDGEVITADQLTFTLDDDAAEDVVCVSNEKDSTFADIIFPEIGDYVITYQDGAVKNQVTVHVNYPEVKFYTSDTVGVDTMINGNFCYSDADAENVVYAILQTQETSIALDEIRIKDWAAGDPAEYGSADQAEEVAKYVEYSDLGSGVYKIKINKTEPFEIGVYATVTFGDGNSESRDCWISVEYSQTMEGLIAKDWFDDNMDLHPEAEFFKEFDAAVLSPKTMYFTYTETENQDGMAVTADQLSVTYLGEGEAATVETNRENSKYVDILFPQTGDYKITYTGDGNKDKTITVHVKYPEVGFYTSQTMDISTMIPNNEFVYSDPDTDTAKRFYMILDAGENRISLDAVNPFAVEDYETGTNYNWETDEAVIQDYFTYEEISTGIYQMDIKSQKPFGISVNAYVETEDGGWNTGSYISINYEPKKEGLLLQWPEWVDDNCVISADKENFSKTTDVDLNMQSVYLAVFEGEEDTTPETVTADAIEVYYEEDAAPAGEEFVTWSVNEGNGDVLDFRFMKTGQYTIKLKNSEKGDTYKSVIVNVGYPAMGFYTSATMTDDGYIRDEYIYGDDGNSGKLYFILNADNARVENFRFELEDYFASYVDIKDAEGNVYEITIDPEKEMYFRLSAYADIQWEGEDQAHENEAIISIMHNNVKDQAGRIVYTDGMKHLGFSGCYLTEKEYDSGWGPDYSNNAPMYWVHAETVQGVIDKLSKVANGEEVLYKEVVDNETGAVGANKNDTTADHSIVNTGYIYVVVSHMGETTLEPQYVSSSGNMKGIHFASGQDLCMTDHELEDGIYIENKIYNLDAVRTDNSGQVPEKFDEVSYVCRYKGEYYAAHQNNPENDYPKYMLDDMLELTAEEKEQFDQWFTTSDNYAMRWDIYSYPQIHVNIYCDMKFDGFFDEGLFVGFKEGKEFSAHMLSDGKEYMTYSMADLGDESTVTKNHTVTYIAYINNIGEVPLTKPITVNLYKINSETCSSGSYGDSVNIGEVPEPNAMTELSKEQKDAIETSAKLTVDMKAEPQQESEVVSANAIKEVVKDERVDGMAYIDLSVSASVEGVEGATEISEILVPMDITIDLPEDMYKKGRKFKLVRHHKHKDGRYETEKIPCTMNGKKIHFKTDRFSTYAIVYDDSQIVADPEKPAPQISTKTNLDMSKAAWNYSAPFTYDGKAKSVVLTGLPQGIAVTYTGNTATAVGTYTAKATFTYDAAKYNAPDVSKISTLTWEIAPSVDSGQKLTVGSNKYKVTSTEAGKKTVAYAGPKKKTAKVKVPSTVKIDGETYKVTEIAEKAFSGNTKLTSVTIPTSVTEIGSSAFKGCKKLKTVTIPKNVKEIGKNAFYGCTQLTKVTFKGTKTTKIGQGAFRKCTALKSATIPKNVTEIGKDAFRDCKKLSKVTIKGKKLKKVGKNAFKNIASKPVIKVPKSKKKAYTTLLKKSGYKKTIK